MQNNISSKRIISTNILLFIIISFYFILSCGKRTSYSLLQKADTFLPSMPDSADSVLSLIDDYKDLNNDDKALYGLLRTYTDNRLGISINTDSLIRNSFSYYNKELGAGSANDYSSMHRFAQCCYFMSLFYSSCDSIKECEDMLRKSIHFSEKCKDWRTCYLAYTKLAMTVLWSNPDYSLELLSKALDNYNKVKDDANNAALILTKRASVYSVISDFDSAIDCYTLALEIAESNNLLKTRNEIYMGMSGTYWQKGQFTTALDYAKKGVETAEGATLNNSQLTLARCYIDADSLKEARTLIRKIDFDSTDYTNKYLTQRYLAEIALRSGDSHDVTTHVDSAFKYMEDVFFHLEQTKDKYYQDNLKKEIENEHAKRTNELNMWIMISIFMISIIIVAFIFFWTRTKRRNERHKRQDLIINQRLQHSIMLNEIRKAELIEQKQNEIINKKNQQICHIQRHLLKRMVNQTGNLYNYTSKMSYGQWKEIENFLNDTDEGFVATLRNRFSRITEDDVRLCMLVRLKATNSLIGIIYGITPSAVKKRKANIKKKIFNVYDPVISLETIIDDI